MTRTRAPSGGAGSAGDAAAAGRGFFVHDPKSRSISGMTASEATSPATATTAAFGTYHAS